MFPVCLSHVLGCFFLLSTSQICLRIENGNQRDKPHRGLGQGGVCVIRSWHILQDAWYQYSPIQAEPILGRPLKSILREMEYHHLYIGYLTSFSAVHFVCCATQFMAAWKSLTWTNEKSLWQFGQRKQHFVNMSRQEHSGHVYTYWAYLSSMLYTSRNRASSR